MSVRLLCLLGVSLASVLFAADRIPITIVNYSKLPIHRTSVPLDLGGPVSARRADNGASVPVTRDGLFVSLPAATRLELVAERVEQWPEEQLVQVTTNSIRNGVVRFTFGKRGWKFGFDAENAALIEDAALDFWVDTQNRGRIMNIGPEKLGLLRFADAPVEKCDTDGRRIH